MLVSLSSLVLAKPFLSYELSQRLGVSIEHLDMYRTQGVKIPLVEVEDPELIYEMERIMGCQIHAESYAQ
jgi:hypothetical protein